tara:strand:- start:4602 stop:4979 length:378 start_codon:yes stop_codon:yes gene_type:complete
MLAPLLLKAETGIGYDPKLLSEDQIRELKSRVLHAKFEPLFAPLVSVVETGPLDLAKLEAGLKRLARFMPMISRLVPCMKLLGSDPDAPIPAGVVNVIRAKLTSFSDMDVVASLFADLDSMIDPS